MGCFNPRARAGRDKPAVRIYGSSQFQSTRPRGARPSSRSAALPEAVSIHAPARGATALTYYDPATYRFNPRARAGRDQTIIGPPKNGRFQSTRPRGARRADSVADRFSLVSIHAPARGATFVVLIILAFLRFNPRARAGRDQA